MNSLSQQFEDLRLAILESIENDDRRTIAKGVVKFKFLFNNIQYIIENINKTDLTIVFLNTENLPKWDIFLSDIIGVLSTIDPSKNENLLEELKDLRIIRGYRSDEPPIFLLRDNSFFEFRDGMDDLIDLENDWRDFILLTTSQRKIIVETLLDMSSRTLRNIRYHDIKFDEYKDKCKKNEHLKLRRVTPLALDEIILPFPDSE